MSLKAFHLLFITVSTVLAAGFAVWALGDYRANGGTSTLITAIASALVVVLLIVYGRWFLRKTKGVKCV